MSLSRHLVENFGQLLSNLLYLPYALDQKINDPWKATGMWALPMPQLHPCNNCERLGFFADPLNNPTMHVWFSDDSNL